MVVDVVLPPIASIVVARAYGPAKLGSYVFFLWMATAATTVCSSGLFSAIRKYLADYAGQRNRVVFRALLQKCLGVELILLISTSIAALLWVTLTAPADERLFGSLIMLSILPAGFTAMATAVNESVQEMRPNVVASICSGILYTGTMLIAVVFELGLVGLSAAYLASRACDCLLRWKLTLAKLPGYLNAMGEQLASPMPPSRLPAGLARQVAVFVGQASVLAVLTMVVWNRSETIFLKRYSAIEQVAYFSVAFGLSVLPGSIVGPFSRAAGASVYAERGRDAQAGLRVALGYWRYLVFLIMPASFGLAVMSSPLLRVLYGVKYIEAAPVLMLAASMSMFGPLANPPTTLMTAAGGQRFLVRNGLVAAAITLILDYFLVRSYAAVGGALANGLGQLLSTCITVIIARRYGFTVSGGFFLRVTAAALGMALTVWAVVQAVPDMVGIAIGPVVGAITYCALLRVGRIVDETDMQRFAKIEGLLPGMLRPPFRKTLKLIAVPRSKT